MIDRVMVCNEESKIIRRFGAALEFGKGDGVGVLPTDKNDNEKVLKILCAWGVKKESATLK